MSGNVGGYGGTSVNRTVLTATLLHPADRRAAHSARIPITRWRTGMG